MPQTRVSITQQSQWFFGQSWPQLIYLPYLAFLDGTTRNTLGLNGVKDFVDEVGPHELAHQWWGHSVAPKTYHDEWISEGFSEFTAGLVLQQTGGWPRYNGFWERKRKAITEKGRGAAMPNNEAGPISQGFRLETWQTPGSYDSIIYSKGAYVLHMLRLMMQDRNDKQNPDVAFMAMMSDFAKSFAGRNATTADFKAIVEKHMTPNLNASGNGKVDWFFDEWVYGTAIPKYTSTFDVKEGGRLLFAAVHESVCGTFQTSKSWCAMSAVRGKGDESRGDHLTSAGLGCQRSAVTSVGALDHNLEPRPSSSSRRPARMLSTDKGTKTT